jgi:eukaryotic-like serine/threonine-protein kinase
VLSAILKDTPELVHEVKPELPPELGRVIRRCLAKDPGHRYQSAVDLRNELEELRDEQRTRERGKPVSGPERARRLSGRTIVAASMVFAAAAVVLYLLPRPAANPASLAFRPFATAEGVESMPA